MLILLSPAKSLDFDRPAPPLPLTQPTFLADAEVLVKVLAKKNSTDIAALMHLSEKLADLNAQRYHEWTSLHSPANSRAAVLAFDGDVYHGLNAATLTSGQLQWADGHIAILSGLYGVIRPLDFMQPYRLEMGTSLKVGRANSLYDYWRKKITPHLNDRLALHNDPTLVNLASQEYFSSVDTATLQAPVVECVFQEGKDGQFKVLGFFAKRARGLMARYAIEHKIECAEGLKDFNEADYRFSPSVSTSTRWVFRRLQPPPVASQRK
jgi:cytoplasmic iron level regulating protein YaaA (DUF328/UPF0246 family)